MDGISVETCPVCDSEQRPQGAKVREHLGHTAGRQLGLEGSADRNLCQQFLASGGFNYNRGVHASSFRKQEASA